MQATASSSSSNSNSGWVPGDVGRTAQDVEEHQAIPQSLPTCVRGEDQQSGDMLSFSQFCHLVLLHGGAVALLDYVFVMPGRPATELQICSLREPRSGPRHVREGQAHRPSFVLSRHPRLNWQKGLDLA